jgi:hypothetical protein
VYLREGLELDLLHLLSAFAGKVYDGSTKFKFTVGNEEVSTGTPVGSVAAYLRFCPVFATAVKQLHFLGNVLKSLCLCLCCFIVASADYLPEQSKCMHCENAGVAYYEMSLLDQQMHCLLFLVSTAALAARSIEPHCWLCISCIYMRFISTCSQT